MKALHEDKSEVRVSYQCLGLSVCMQSLITYGAVHMHVGAHGLAVKLCLVAYILIDNFNILLFCFYINYMYGNFKNREILRN
jgi:hypothetical protein